MSESERMDDESVGRQLIASNIISVEQAQYLWAQAQQTGVPLIELARRSGYVSQLQNSQVTGGPGTESQGASANNEGLPAVGQVIDGYEILTCLGQGGMGAVFKARKHDLLFAIKFCLEPSNALLMERFEREIKTMSRFQHDNIVRVHEHNLEHLYPYYVLDYVDGVSLEDLAKTAGNDDGMAEDEIRDYLNGILAALAEIHRQGLVHRDLKPANVLIRKRDQQVLLMDFGIVLDDMQQTLTKTGQVVGTTNYLAPEQLDTRRNIPTEELPKIDVWAIGVLVYELFAGETPFQADSSVAAYKKILSGKYQDLRSQRPDISAQLLEFVEACLQLDYSKRPTIEQLQGLLNQSQSRSKWWRWRKIKPMVIVAITLLIAGLLCAAAVYGLQTEAKLIAATINGQSTKALVRVKEPKAKLELEFNVAVKGLLLMRADGQRFAAIQEKSKAIFKPELKPGLNEFTFADKFKANSGYDRVGTLGLKTVSIFYDNEQPTLKFINCYSIVPGLLLYREKLKDGKFEEGFRPAIEVVDQSPVRLLVNGEELPLEENKLTVESRFWGRPLDIEAIDAAGQSMKAKLKLRKVQSVHMESKSVLQNLKKWDRATETKQDWAISFVGLILGKDYRFVETRRYSCSNTEHRIAVFEHLKTGIIFHLVPGGAFERGVKQNQFAEEVRAFKKIFANHRVASNYGRTNVEGIIDDECSQSPYISKISPFLISRFELRNREWKKIGGPVLTELEILDPGAKHDPEAFTAADHSLSNRSYLDCHWRLAELGMNLPTENQWEWAYRAGTTTRFYWGREYDAKYVNKPQRLPNNAELRYQQQCWNAFGLIDMAGGMSEYVTDKYGPRRLFGEDVFPVHNPNEARHVIKGGNWRWSPAHYRSTSRFFVNPQGRHDNIGVRVIRNLRELWIKHE